MPQLDISTFSSQIFWLLITFILTYIFIRKIIAPKCKDILTKRDDIIAQHISNARNYKKQAESLQVIHQSKINDINLYIEKLRKDAILLLDNKFEQKQKELKKELNNITIRAIAEIKDAKKSFAINEKNVCIDLASFIIKKITHVQVDKELLKESLNKLN